MSDLIERAELLDKNMAQAKEIERLIAAFDREQKQNMQHVLYYSALEKTNADQLDEIERLTAELLKRDAIWLPEKDARIAKLEAAIKDIEPYTDAIICYASTITEHDGNRIAKLFRELALKEAI